MTEKFSKRLDIYTTEDGHYKRGNYHFLLPEGLERNCYPMRIEYESRDVAKPDAFVYRGYIVIGGVVYIVSYPIIVPYDTSALTEEEITNSEKLDTEFEIKVSAFSNENHTTPAKYLPLSIRVFKNNFRDYYEDISTAKTQMQTDYDVNDNVSLTVTGYQKILTLDNWRYAVHMSTSVTNVAPPEITGDIFYSGSGYTTYYDTPVAYYNKTKNNSLKFEVTCEAKLTSNKCVLGLIRFDDNAYKTVIGFSREQLGISDSSFHTVSFKCEKNKVDVYVDNVKLTSKTDTAPSTDSNTRFHFACYSESTRCQIRKLRYSNTDNNIYTNNKGVITNILKIGDIYSTAPEINNENTLLYKCKGTTNRGSDNYVPEIKEAPLILGTTNVWLYNDGSTYDGVQASEVDYELPSTSWKIGKTCGMGTIELKCDLIYSFAMHSSSDNRRMKYNYEYFRDDNTYYCKVGSLQLQYNAGDGWVNVPASQLTRGNQNTTIKSDGTIVQTSGKQNGSMSFIWTNPLPYSTHELIRYRFKYIGKTGATFGSTSNIFYLALDSTFGTPATYNTRLQLTSNIESVAPNQNVILRGQLQVNTGNGWVNVSGDGKGVATIVLPDESVVTRNIKADGTFGITLNFDEVGTHTVTVSTHDSTGLFADTTATKSITVNSNSTYIDITSPTLNNNSISKKNGSTVTIQGYVKDSSNDEILSISANELTMEWANSGTTVSSNKFSCTSPAFTHGDTTIIINYNPTSNEYSGCSKSITLSGLDLDTVINPSITNNTWNTKRIGTLSGTVKDENGGNVNGTLSCTDFTIPVSNGTFNKEIDLTASKFNNVSSTTFDLTFTPSDTGFNSSSKTINANISPLDVNITAFNSWLRVMDTTPTSTELFKLKIDNGTSTPIDSGTLKLEIAPIDNSYNIAYTEIWNTTVSSLNQWSVSLSSFGNRFNNFIEAVKATGRLAYVNYHIKATYTSASPIYNSNTVVFSKYFGYCCSPRLKLTTSSKYISTGNSYTSPTPINIVDTSVADSIAGNNNSNTALIERTYNLADDNTMVLELTNSATGERIGGVEWGMWFISDETVHIWAVESNNSGNLVYDSRGNKIEWTNYTYEDTNIPISPAYAGYPIKFYGATAEPEIRLTTYNTDLGMNWEAKITSYDEDMVFKWKEPYTELTTMNLYLYITLSGALGNLFIGNYEINSPYHSLVGGVNPDHTYTHPIDAEYNRVIKIKLNIHK